MERFKVVATITGSTHNFYNMNGIPAVNDDYVIFHPRAKNEANAVNAARRIARLAGCSASVESVSLFDDIGEPGELGYRQGGFTKA